MPDRKYAKARKFPNTYTVHTHKFVEHHSLCI